MKVFSLVALIASTSAVQLDVIPVDRMNWPGAILPADRAHEKAPGSTFVDKDFDPMFDRYRYGNTYVNASSLAQSRHETRQRLAKQLRASLVQIDNSPSDVNMLQMSDEICETVECAKQQAAQMQAQLDAGVAEADAKRDAQEAAFKSQDSNDPAAQLQGLMNAQASLKRLTTGFTSKPNVDKVTTMAQKLGIPMTPELMQLGNNEAISNALVEIAVGMGKSEDEITKALGPDE